MNSNYQKTILEKLQLKKIWQDTKEQMSKRPIDITATITGGEYANKDIKINGEIDKWQKRNRGKKLRRQWK